MDSFQVRLKAIRWEAQGINTYELRPLPGQELPPFTAGAHIDVHLPSGLIRSYSLCNPQFERHRYVIGVNKDANSRGGSAFMHESLRVGDVLTIAGPRNNFPLAEDARHSVLIAGGIGITPLWCMVQRLQELGRSWELYYCVRNRQCAAFLDDLRGLGERVHTNLHFNFDQEPGGQLLDLAKVVGAAPPDAHLYCCGPLPMLAAFEQATAGLPSERVHVEYFAAKEAPDTSGGFTVELAKSKRVIKVAPGKTILDAVLDEGIDVPYSCMEGVCATCETRVLDGIPDHRDLVLSKEEQAANKTMMICCSGAKSERLVLDL
ncbi:MAG TPA: PDR/VanB family oxidoreductase [Burkholderiaceae bacterium]|nr:PDR/VanB family oxidoreductase [Burkholderiaceae bacterium]